MAGAAETTSGGLVVVFVICLLIPIQFSIGGMQLSPNRVFLILAFVPLLVRWMSGGAGGILPIDIFVGLHCLWIALAFFMVHGTSEIPFAGITVLEIFASYLAGRVLIRNAADYRAFFRVILIALAVLAPIAVVEMLTGRMLVNELFDPIAETFPKTMGDGPRWGLVRAQTVFQHPILFGVFCTIAVANVFYLYRASLAQSVLFSGFATAMAFASLSAGPLLSAALQYGVIGWGWITRNAWWALVGLCVAGYVFVDIAANRSPVTILISYVTFNSDTAWNRIYIWEFGIREVWRNPFFGLGLNDWQRAFWMPSSVDNFWLLTAMRYGIPAFLLLFLGIVASLRRIFERDLPAELVPYRLAYVVAAVGLFMTLCTVHVWGSTFILVMFYLGAGTWLYDTAPAGEPVAAATPARGRPTRRTARETGTEIEAGTAIETGAGAASTARADGRGTRDAAAARRGAAQATRARRLAAYGAPRR